MSAPLCCRDTRPESCKGDACECPCHADAHPRADEDIDVATEAVVGQLVNAMLEASPRVLSDGRAVRLAMQFGGNVLLTISRTADSMGYDDGW